MNIKMKKPKGNRNYIFLNFSKLKWLIAFLNRQTELSSTIDSGKQFQISIIRQEKDDLRQLITHNGLTNFKLWPRKEEIWANSKNVFIDTD